MKLPVFLTSAAADEFEAAVAWYEDEQPGMGIRFKEAVLTAIGAIQDHPQTYPRIHRAFRRARVKNFPYSVMYLHDSAAIRIIAVFHMHRNPNEWMSRDSE